MSKERFKFISAVHLFLVRENEVLLARRFNTGYEDGNYSVPAGHLDGGESAIEGMIREAREEAGVEIKREDLRMVHVMHRNAADTERIDFFFEAKRWVGEPEIMEPNKCDTMGWFPLNELPGNIIPYLESALENYKRESVYSEFGFNH